MNRTLVVGGVAALVLAAVGVGLLTHPDAPAPIYALNESKVVWLDGGKLYSIKRADPDGGVATELRIEAPCRRRLPGSACLFIDGGAPPDFARYLASELIGSCDAVACSVWAGQDPDAPEVQP
jgi:hypothetical protein